jgi:hypothetical protein
MQIIPLDPVPSQSVKITLAGQNVRVNVYQKSTGLFMDVLLNEALLIGGVICHDLCLIVRDAYFGLIGDFTFIDNQGLTDPVYTGLGARYSLAYLEAVDVAVVGVA